MEGIYIALICVGAAVAVGCVALFIRLSNNLIQISEYTVESDRVREEGVRIVHLSDLHAKSFGKDNVRLVKKVERLRPDFIAVTGDVIHKYRNRDIAVAENIIKRLVKIAPVYYVSGNHEMRSTKYKLLKERLIACGACVLDDCSVKASGINLCGVNCASIKRGRYCELIKDSRTEFNLLLAHLPQYMRRYATAGFDLVLCGHAHGGQWRIPFTGIGIYAPGQGLFPEYACGEYKCGDTTGIVSRGLGNSECPVRLFNRPEIVLVDIKNPAGR